MFTPPLQRAPEGGQYTAAEEQLRGQRAGHGHPHGHPAPPTHTDPRGQGHRLPPSPVVSQTQLYSGERICRLPKRSCRVYVFFDGYGPNVYTGPTVHRTSTGRRSRYTQIMQLVLKYYTLTNVKLCILQVLYNARKYIS